VSIAKIPDAFQQSEAYKDKIYRIVRLDEMIGGQLKILEAHMAERGML